LRVAFCPLRIDKPSIDMLRAFWEKKGAEVIETTPERHDKDTVFSQALTYSIADIVQNMHIPELTFTTKSSNALQQIAEHSGNDSGQLFHDMLFYNPYFPEMKKQLEQAIGVTSHKLQDIAAEQANAQDS
jgi:prephenate dehydrogenase